MKCLAKIESPSMRPAMLCEIPLAQIRIPEGRAPRNLVKNIQARGLIEPVVLRQAEDGSDGFEPVAGRRRLQALLEMGCQSVIAIVRVEADDQCPADITLSENLVRSRNLLSEVHAYREMRQSGRSMEDIQKELGIFKRDLKTLDILSNMSPMTESALGSGQLSPSGARVMAKLPTEAQNAYFTQSASEKYTLESVKVWRMSYLFQPDQMSFLMEIPLH